MDADPAAIEAAVGAIGLEAILAGEPTWHRYQIDEALALPRKIRAELRAFYASDGFEKVSKLPTLDYKRASELLDKAGDERHAQALIAAVGDERLANEIGAVVTRIVGVLGTALPRQREDTIVGPRDGTPDRESLARFRALWGLATDPLRLLTEMREGQLYPELVQQFEALWPGIYAAIGQAEIEARVAAKAGRAKSWQPSAKKVRQVLTLQQAATIDPGLAGAVAQVYAEGGTQKQRPPAPSAPTQDMTPGQKAEAGAT